MKAKFMPICTTFDELIEYIKYMKEEGYRVKGYEVHPIASDFIEILLEIEK